MVEAAQESRPQAVSFIPSDDDWDLMVRLRRKMGLNQSSIFRLAIRALAEKERVSA